ncbi:hypothetical protein [Streptomyces sp. TE5632]
MVVIPRSVTAKLSGRRRTSAYRSANRSANNQDVVGCAHSVVTAHLVDQDGHPTLRARNEIITFLAERLDTQSE